MTKLVSIIIACHNAEPYLAEAIDSALQQTHQSVEVIVVDDGSTDKSRLIAEDYGKRLTVIHQRQSGPGAARNRGVRAAHGQYIAFLDADDRLHPEFIQASLQTLGDRSRTYTYAKMERFGKQTGISPTMSFSPGFLVLRSNYIGIGILMPKQLFLEVNGFDERLTAFEDWDLYLKLLEHGVRGHLVDRPLYQWRFHHAETRNQVTARKFANIKRQLNKRYWKLRLRYAPELLLGKFGRRVKI